MQQGEAFKTFFDIVMAAAEGGEAVGGDTILPTLEPNPELLAKKKNAEISEVVRYAEADKEEDEAGDADETVAAHTNPLIIHSTPSRTLIVPGRDERVL